MGYMYPVPKGTPVSQWYGTNPGGVNPSGGHTGMDFACPVGTPVYAPADGVIVLEGWCRDPRGADNPWLLTDGGGIVIVLDAGDAFPTFIMGHLSATLVDKGQRVRKGDLIGYTGNTGRWTTGPHCHFEVLLPYYNLRSNTYGRSNPVDVCDHYKEDLAVQAQSVGGPATRKVTTEGANVRVAPWTSAGTAPGYEDGLAAGATLGVVGYVKGEDVSGQRDDAWYKTVSGYYVWANAASNDISGLVYLGEVARPADPAPAPAPAPAPEPAPAPAPAPSPDPLTQPGAVLHGIDISNHQAGIQVGPTGAQFVGIKASEGVGWLDPALAANVASARAAGVPVVFYHFARPVSDENTPELEAGTFMDAVRPLLAPGDRVALDWEAEHQENTAWALRWLDLVRKGLGLFPLIYMNGTCARTFDWAAVQRAGYRLWLATYPTTATVEGFRPPSPTHPDAPGWVVDMWQYASTGRLPGYNRDLDLNVFYGDRVLWDALAQPIFGGPAEPAPDPEPAPAPVPAPTDDLAAERAAVERFLGRLLDGVYGGDK